MKSYLMAALIAMPAFAFGAHDASAGGCRGPYCGGGGYHNGHNGYPKEYFVNIPTIVSDRPAPGFRTNIHVRAGTRITAVCDDYDWCRILSPRFANLFVARYCLDEIGGHRGHGPRYFHHNKHFYENGGGRGRREYGGGAYEQREEIYEENGNGRYGNGYREDYNGNGRY